MRITMLGPDDTDWIIKLEQRSFIPALQATRQMMLRRFEFGHLMYGLIEGNELVGMLGVSYGRFDPDDFGSFPRTEHEYGMQAVPANYNAVFTYNLEVEPSSRGREHSKALFQAAIDRAKREGCAYGIGCSRIPSYAGSDPQNTQEAFPHSPEFKDSIDRYLQGGPFPTLAELTKDPLLALYYRLGEPAQCKFHWIIPNFATHDHASGGIRVILYGETRNWHSSE